MTAPGRLLSAAALLFVAAATAAAQPRVQGGLGVPVGVPVGEFAEKVGGAAGFTGYLDLGIGRSVVSVGGEAGFLVYGTESRELDIGAAVPELAGATVTLSTTNAMVLVHGRVRLQPRTGRWRPYVDGLYGFTYIYTSTTVEDDDWDSSSSGIHATNVSDFVASYGAGAGVRVDIAGPGGTFLDFGLRYLRGGKADYLAQGGIRRENGQAVLDLCRSRTDMVLAVVALSFGG